MSREGQAAAIRLWKQLIARKTEPLLVRIPIVGNVSENDDVLVRREDVSAALDAAFAAGVAFALDREKR